MTLLVISPDYASHAGPLLTLAAAWRDAGERVVVATGPAVAPLVARQGMELVRLALGRGSNPGVARPGDQPAGEDDNLRAFFEATRRGMVATLRYQAEARANDLLWQPVETARRTMAILDEIRPDEILVDHLAFGATIGLRAAGVAYADVVLGHPRQLPIGAETYGVPGSWPSAFAPDGDELAGLERTARRVADQFTSAYNDALRLVDAHSALVDDAFSAHGSPVLFNYPQALHDGHRTAGLPTAHAFLGGTPRREEPTTAVAAWLERDPGRPLILVSFGTFLSARDDVLGVVADGLRKLDVRVALATGSTDPRRLGALPSDWLVRSYLPQVALLEHASGLITHAGNNSVTEAVAQGVPMLALPFSTDQFDGAAAIEASGLGLAADPNHVGPADVADAVRRLISTAHPALDRLSDEIGGRSGARIARSAVGEWHDGASTVRT